MPLPPLYDDEEEEEAPRRSRRAARHVEEDEHAAYKPHKKAVDPYEDDEDDEEEYAPRASRRAKKQETEKKVFLFEDEEDEPIRKRSRRDYDEYDDDDYDYDDDEEEGGGRAIRIVTIIALIIVLVGSCYILLRSELGARLRASTGIMATSEDYLTLADWQKKNNNSNDAASSYYSAFLVDPADYDVTLEVAKGFTEIGNYERAEQTYLYLIEKNPTEDEPYDLLLALFNTQGKVDYYNALIQYRAEHQPGYVAPAAPQFTLSAPNASSQSGVYTGSISLQLTAQEGATIYYTLDNTAPTTASFSYVGPITITSGTHTIRAVAVLGDQVSDEWLGQFTIQ